MFNFSIGSKQRRIDDWSNIDDSKWQHFFLNSRLVVTSFLVHQWLNLEYIFFFVCFVVVLSSVFKLIGLHLCSQIRIRTFSSVWNWQWWKGNRCSTKYKKRKTKEMKEEKKSEKKQRIRWYPSTWIPIRFIVFNVLTYRRLLFRVRKIKNLAALHLLSYECIRFYRQT